MRKPQPKVLIVEGKDELRVLPHLIEFAGVNWGPPTNPIVRIDDYDGIENILRDGVLETQLKASGLTTLGVIVDADVDATARWTTLCSRLPSEYRPKVGTSFSSGWIVRPTGQPAFGAWVMPDNERRGMIETFLLFLRPRDNQQLLDYAETAVREAITRGAPISDQHLDKALIHTWLAWQDPPGRQMHNAVMERMLRNSSPQLSAFIRWFCELYELPTPAHHALASGV